jgi:hypothetical protein
MLQCIMTKDEIEKIERELEELAKKMAKADWGVVDENTPWLPGTETKGCDHTWSHYIGVTESYLFCTRCDKKWHENGVF